MPSFSLLKKKRNEFKGQNETINGARNSPEVINVVEKAQRSHSKRDFFRNLLSGATSLRTSRRRGEHTKDSNLLSPTKPASPMFDLDKPLPQPPSTTSAIEPPIKSVKLDRIIPPISIPDIHKLFSGAPQFFARSEGQHSGSPKPSVAFPWNTELETKDLSDHGQIEDQAWGCVTAIPHITRDLGKGTEAVRQNTEKERTLYIPRCHERPNMLSMQGLERGTIGFSAALELGASDVLLEEKDPTYSPNTLTLSDRRAAVLDSNKYGVRPLTESDVVAKLIEIGESYDENISLHKKPSVEMYTELFTQVLYPPTRVTDLDDPYSFRVQIQAIVDVLATPNIWFDFSLVEWRLKLGQILWGPPSELDIGDEISIDGESIFDPGTQKFWLLLQILISCELLIRLDTTIKRAEYNPSVITVEQVLRFEQEAKSSIKWSMILARSWLENIQVENIESNIVAEAKKSTSGWLAAIRGRGASDDTMDGPTASVSYRGKHQARQLFGLFHFARKLNWPRIEDLVESFSMNPANTALSGESSPAGETPLSVSTQRSSYFDFAAQSVIRRGLSKQRLSANIRPSGWLSNSYLTGLVLPGEGLSHFLISTLLEHDKAALAQLGDEASLYGGFIYSTKSFWSTSCIVGRVLTAGKGASECMGWLSSDILPTGLKEGWVNVEVELVSQDEAHHGRSKPRIGMKQAVEHDSSVLGDGDINSILPGDFTFPVHDFLDTENFEVKLESLDLIAARSSAGETPSPGSSDAEDFKTGKIIDCSATMRFVVKLGGRGTELDFDLRYDVHFVTAHPCIPSHHTDILKPSRSPLQKSGSLDDSALGPHIVSASHPLHKSFAYRWEMLSHILIHSQSASASTSKDSLLSSIQSPSQEVFIVDCAEPDFPSQPVIDMSPISTSTVPQKSGRGSDLEMLARAWCSENGYNALISREGRNCISCSIREARALGWKIVLRFR